MVMGRWRVSFLHTDITIARHLDQYSTLRVLGYPAVKIQILVRILPAVIAIVQEIYLCEQIWHRWQPEQWSLFYN